MQERGICNFGREGVLLVAKMTAFSIPLWTLAVDQEKVKFWKKHARTWNMHAWNMLAYATFLGSPLPAEHARTWNMHAAGRHTRTWNMHAYSTFLCTANAAAQEDGICMHIPRSSAPRLPMHKNVEYACIFHVLVHLGTWWPAANVG